MGQRHCAGLWTCGDTRDIARAPWTLRFAAPVYSVFCDVVAAVLGAAGPRDTAQHRVHDPRTIHARPRTTTHDPARSSTIQHDPARSHTISHDLARSTKNPLQIRSTARKGLNPRRILRRAGSTQCSKILQSVAGIKKTGNLWRAAVLFLLVLIGKSLEIGTKSLVSCFWAKNTWYRFLMGRFLNGRNQPVTTIFKISLSRIRNIWQY
jgi:hypothetical protein